MEWENIVIGSGPTGVACAVALLAQGRRVLMVDAGQHLEPEREARLVQLGGSDPQGWWGPGGEWLREGMEGAVEGIPLKLAYGSDFPYRTLPGATRVQGEDVNTKFSLGKGGLSAVWGAAVMPYRQHDLTDWPVTAAEMAEHYRAVLEFMPVAQGVDGLEQEFPTLKPSQPMPLSAQAAAMLADLEKNAAGLRSKGVSFGRSRLAVNASRCVRCGLCMYGCPHRLIYSSAQTVDVLRANPNFAYAPGLVAQRVTESGDRATVEVLRTDGEWETFTASRVFVAAGVLPSTALLLRSLGVYGKAVTLKESHYFLLPMLRLKSVPGFSRRELHTLAQLFVEVMDESLSPYTVHLQTYTYNDLFEQPIRKMLGPLGFTFPWQAFLSRLFLFQGYLHSDHSPLTRAVLEREGEGDVLRLKAQQRPETAGILKRLVGKLSSVGGMTGLRPLSMLMRRGEPGRGFHTGASFPMSARPQGLESDVLGRPAGLRRVHVVDSSVIPSVPATTITFTTMANAHRIGTLAAREGLG
jgi:choline dehydrogenase-like flavoprotein